MPLRANLTHRNVAGGRLSSLAAFHAGGSRAAFRWLVIFAGLWLFGILPAAAQEQREWTWKGSEGQTHTRAELDEILRAHEEWIESSKKRGRPAMLFGADLSDAFLSGASLSGAYLIRASLSGANLLGANLSGADLKDGSLSGAVLANANLTGTNLNGTDLDSAQLWGANVHSAVYQAKSNPEIRSIAVARNLEFITYSTSPSALVRLRKEFLDAGYYEQEGKITYALKRREAELFWLGCWPWAANQTRRGFELPAVLLWSDGAYGTLLRNCVNYWFNRVFFDLTTQYGMTPGHALEIVGILWFALTLVYVLFIHRSGRSGLYVVKKRLWKGKDNTREIQIRPRLLPQTSLWKLPFYLLRREWRLFRAAMFFSLMSAFNIGFRDINFGRWLRLLTKREYDIKAVGWARTVAGFQSLFSVILIALFVLTFFGRPFE